MFLFFCKAWKTSWTFLLRITCSWRSTCRTFRSDRQCFTSWSWCVWVCRRIDTCRCKRSSNTSTGTATSSSSTINTSQMSRTLTSRPSKVVVTLESRHNTSKLQTGHNFVFLLLYCYYGRFCASRICDFVD